MRPTRLAGFLACALLAAAATACGGGDDDGGFCDGFAFAACGGDPVGAWSLAHVCPAASSTVVEYASEDFPGCSATNVSRSTRSLGAVALTLSSDGSYTRTIGTSDAFTVTMDRPCAALVAAEIAPGASLETVCQFVEDQNSSMAGGCDVSGDLCRCSFTSSDSDTEAGTYTVNGTELVLSNAWSALPFCVAGAQLTLQYDQTLAGQDATYLVLTR